MESIDTAVQPQEMRQVMSRFATGVTIVTTSCEGAAQGMTVSAFSSVSLDPPLVLVCVNRDAKTRDLVVEAGAFAVNILAADQSAVSTAFAKPNRPVGDEQFAGLSWWRCGRTGAPVLGDAIAHVSCTLHDAHEAGDHTILVGRVIDIEQRRDTDPLVYFSSGYRWLSDK